MKYNTRDLVLSYFLRYHLPYQKKYEKALHYMEFSMQHKLKYFHIILCPIKYYQDQDR